MRIKNFSIKKQLSSFFYFYSYLKYRIFALLFLNVFVGIIDSLGLTMFFPLLQLVNEQNNEDELKMGGFDFILSMIQRFGFKINLESILVLMVVFFLLKGVITYLTKIYQVLLQKQFMQQIRLDLIDGVNKINYKSFMSLDQGMIQNTMTGEVERVFIGLTTYFQTFSFGVLVFVYISFAFFINAEFAILISLGGLTTNILYRLLYKKTKGISRKLTTGSNSYQGLIIQNISNFKYIKATNLSLLFVNKLKTSATNIENKRKKIGILKAILVSVREPMLIIIIALVIYIQVVFLKGLLGGIIVSLLFFYRALNSLTQLQNSWNLHLSVYGSFDNLKVFQNLLLENTEDISSQDYKKFRNQLELKNVNFKYAENHVLKDINLKIRQNETIAFVGESGSGKTTLMNIISGLLAIEDGRIFIDNIDSTEINIKNFQNRIGYITQDPVIFNASIFDNITLWAKKNNANITRFKNVIRKVHLEEFILSTAENEETVLGNNGLNISGGQKQRISIARELYKEIDILIMDEATSSLDAETEKHIQYNIDSLNGKLPILIVAHRLSTIQNADRIIFMKNGKIAYDGKFKELEKNNKDFSRMIELQSFK